MTPEEQRSDDRYATLQAEHARTKDEVRRLQAELNERDQLNERLLADAKKLSADNAEVERLRAELAAAKTMLGVDGYPLRDVINGVLLDRQALADHQVKLCAEVERLTAALREIQTWSEQGFSDGETLRGRIKRALAQAPALPGEAVPRSKVNERAMEHLRRGVDEPTQAPEAAPAKLCACCEERPATRGDCCEVCLGEAAPREEAPAKVRDEPVLGEVWESDMGSLRAAVQDAEHRLTYQARVDCATLKRVLNVLAHAPTEPREPPELPAGISLRMCHHGGSMTNDLTTYSYETRLYAKPKKWLCIDRDFKVTHEGFTPDEVAAVLAHHIARRAR